MNPRVPEYVARIRTYVPDVARRAREARLILTARVDPLTYEVMITVKRPGGSEASGTAANGPGDREPSKVLTELINRTLEVPA